MIYMHFKIIFTALFSMEKKISIICEEVKRSVSDLVHNTLI